MTLSSGRRLGPYEILSPLGSGGMGEVYKARDIRLDRPVAIKVLPSEVASDPERLRRFEQEARAASALNHPNILTIYDVGSADSISYIAMELIEGKTLRDLLLKGPLPVKKLLDLAVQIAEGLASAHEAGIVHRDLKPSNIIISKDGFAKILDFGLAKLPTPAPMLSAGHSDSITETLSETQPGAIVGTIDYMSPEQAAGQEADYRSDQFAFGSILYEMATGEHAFRRRTKLETLAAVLHEEPEVSVLIRHDAPPPLRWIVERCLTKNALERYVSTRDLAGDMKSLLDHFSEVGSLREGSKPWRSVERSRIVARAGLISLVSIIVLSGLAVWRLQPRFLGLGGTGAKSAAGRFSFLVTAPEGTSFNFGSSSPSPAALSPDGRRLVFGATDSSGRSRLWVRSLDELVAKPLPGTENATYPFWAPDSRSMAFFSDGQLRRVDSAGGPAQIVCPAREGRGGDWSAKGVILFAPDNDGPLFAVNADGSRRRQVTQERSSRSDFNHRWPHFLPDGTHFLYLAYFRNISSGRNGVYAGSLESSDRRFLLPDLSNAAYSAPGYLLFVRNGSLMTALFDAAAQRIMSPPIPIVDQLSYHGYRWYGSFTVSRTGSLAFLAAASDKTQLQWFSRDGNPLGSIASRAGYEGLRLAPNGERCAVEIRDRSGATVDIWTIDLNRGVADRLTTTGANIAPVWSPDGSQLVFTSNRDRHWKLFLKSSLGGGADEAVTRSEGDDSPTDWSPDGKLVVFNHSSVVAQQHTTEIWMLSLADRRTYVYLRSPANNQDAVFSPDGRFLAYSSDESGQPEVYVCKTETPGARWRISSDKGSWPSWRGDGRELYYLAGNTIMAAGIDLRERPEVTSARALFDAPFHATPSNVAPYCVTRDGRKFLIVSGSGGMPMMVIPNWIAAFGGSARATSKSD